MNWKGGRIKIGSGYMWIYKPDHPAARYGKKYVAEHRYVMEQHLGRYLVKDEQVHHKNGVRDDNRIENLELRTGNHGPYINVRDAIISAKEILKKYGDDETKYNKH